MVYGWINVEARPRHALCRFQGEGREVVACGILVHIIRQGLYIRIAVRVNSACGICFLAGLLLGCTPDASLCPRHDVSDGECRRFQ
jgi:hypothetical protein